MKITKLNEDFLVNIARPIVELFTKLHRVSSQYSILQFGRRPFKSREERHFLTDTVLCGLVMIKFYNRSYDRRQLIYNEKLTRQDRLDAFDQTKTMVATTKTINS